jgi:hypothetical protein
VKSDFKQKLKTSKSEVTDCDWRAQGTGAQRKKTTPRETDRETETDTSN